MDIYTLINLINDTYNIVFRVFDCNSQNLVFITDDEDEKRTDFEADELLWSDYANYEVGSMDMWMDGGKIYIEFNIEIDEEDEW